MRIHNNGDAEGEAEAVADAGGDSAAGVVADSAGTTAEAASVSVSATGSDPADDAAAGSGTAADSASWPAATAGDDAFAGTAADAGADACYSEVPEGFFSDVAAQLGGISASEVSEAVIGVCMSRGILHPELEEEPDSQLRADELREVFRLVELSALAVSDGTLVPARNAEDWNDADMAGLWARFSEDAADPAVDEKVKALVAGDTL